ncbi:hypothetical protein HNQ37_000594 [Lactovum miscens]|uniref:Uncharacterized protein n=1 Tax=Lactovum miscens TaxID=190387 RepID=A0A841C926_9LACT|nr:hypothetical protein [Lactovum miscens]
MSINLYELNSDDWASDSRLAETFGVKIDTMRKKVRAFEANDPEHVIKIGSRLTFVPAFIAWSEYERKYRNVSRKPKFEFEK